MAVIRTVAKSLRGQETVDGAGVQLKRILGSRELMQWDPFLLLDEFKNDDPAAYIAGFPSHPHRGFQTVTYMLAGHFRHKDSQGNEGHLTAGSVQWMSAGRGIIHSEMPKQTDGLVWGYQLWLNLPAKNKMDPPHYQDIGPDAIPHVIQEGLEVKLIAGEFGGQTGPGQSPYPLSYFDVRLDSGSRFEYPVPKTMNTFIYVYEGQVAAGPPEQSSQVSAGNLAIMEDGDRVAISGGPVVSRFLFAAARRLEEPIVRHGPFVMNTEAEIQQAIIDYQSGVLDKP